jgi:hypothetical protein
MALPLHWKVPLFDIFFVGVSHDQIHKCLVGPLVFVEITLGEISPVYHAVQDEFSERRRRQRLVPDVLDLACRDGLSNSVLFHDHINDGVLERGDHVFVAKQPDSHKLFPREFVLFFVGNDTAVNEVIEDFKHILMLVRQRDLSFGGLSERTAECGAKIVGVEHEKIFVYDIGFSSRSDFDGDICTFVASAEAG